MRETLQRVARSPLSWSFVATALRFGSAVLLLPLMLRRILSDELGLWYIFVSLGAFAALLDLGFAPTVVRSAGYLWAGSAVLIPFGIELVNPALEAVANKMPNIGKLEDLVASLRRYYSLAGLAVLFLLLTLG